MRKFILSSIMLLLLETIFSAGIMESKDIESWEKKAQLGRYYSKFESSRDIKILANQEGEVVVYANTPKVYDFCKSFYNRYLIKPYPHYLETEEIFKKIELEHASGFYNVDVIITNDSPECYFRYSQRNLFSYIPQNVKKNMSSIAATDDLSIQRFGGKLMIYNNIIKKGESPADNWWDLTRKENKGKTAFQNPLNPQSIMPLLATMVYNSDDLELAYYEEFKQELSQSTTNNAGYEFIKRLLQNDPVLTTKDDDTARLVHGGSTNGKVIFGIIDAAALEIKNTEALNIDAKWDLKPFSGVFIKNVVVIPAFAPNPNAAKLMIDWLYGYSEREGYNSFRTVGDWSVLNNAEKIQGQPYLKDVNFWNIDDEWMYENIAAVREYWITNR